jgi:tRNA-dihydrouridine synthase
LLLSIPLHCRGLIDNGARAICIHGRTRGSSKKRRCGPADLQAINQIAATLREVYKGQVPIVSNGNITTFADVSAALKATPSCIGVMSAEGILRDPALFFQQCVEFGKRKLENTEEGLKPSLATLFHEYCSLSEKYRVAGGWVVMDKYYRASIGLKMGVALKLNQTIIEQQNAVIESRQIYIARQHLMWMLGKSGHGRCVRFTHIGENFKKHVYLLSALNDAKSMADLAEIATQCLPSNSSQGKHVYVDADHR